MGTDLELVGQFLGVNGDRPRTRGTVLWSEWGQTPELRGQFSGVNGDRPRTWGTVLGSEWGLNPEHGVQFSGVNGDRPRTRGQFSGMKGDTELGVQFSGENGDSPRTWGAVLGSEWGQTPNLGTVLWNQRGQTSPSRANALKTFFRNFCAKERCVVQKHFFCGCCIAAVQ